MTQPPFANPFRPGAGHRPPYLAGRKAEQAEFAALLEQDVITSNLVLTGLRGVGKTVLLEDFKPMAVAKGWLWVGTDLSEAASISEANLAHRLITDLSVVTGTIEIQRQTQSGIGFGRDDNEIIVRLDYNTLIRIYENAPGLPIDKLKALLHIVYPAVLQSGKSGIVFAYDEAQNLADHAQKDQYPLSLLLDLFQSAQRQNFRLMLALVGLPTLFPKLVAARTYAERMFRVLFLKQLSESESKEAITKPISDSKCPVRISEFGVNSIVKNSGGYPYFIQFICREAYDAYLQKVSKNETPLVPLEDIARKLDSDFFAGRWSRVTDRQQELLYVIAQVDSSSGEFTVQEIDAKSRELLEKPFGRSHINQMLNSLISAGLVYRDRHGKYLFAVPMMSDFIRRNYQL